MTGIFLIWIPALLLLYVIIKKKDYFHVSNNQHNSYVFPKSNFTFPLSLILWVFIISTAAAYKRGGMHIPPPNRYGDFLILVIPAIIILADYTIKYINYPPKSIIFKFYKFILILSLLTGSVMGLKVLPSIKQRRIDGINLIQQAYAAEMAAHGSGLEVLKKAHSKVLPYPSPSKLWLILNTKPLKDYLPSELRIKRHIEANK
jgi:hypothetical protein